VPRDLIFHSRNVVCGRSEDGGHSDAAIRMSEQLRLVIRRPNNSGSGSEEEKMSRIALSHKAAKLMKLCDLEGYKRSLRSAEGLSQRRLAAVHSGL
jgi:hypothetical protein